MRWKQEEILSCTGGEVLRQGGEKVFGEIVTDSRKVRKGSVFVALRGERLDGHKFLGDAVRLGARCLLVDRQPPRRRLADVTVVRVRDTLKALGDLAHYRRKLVSPRVLAITGSNGKTTTKEMVAAILERASLYGAPLRGKVLKTEGNYNNLVGLPLTLLRLRGAERAAVVELGTNRPGEIARLAQIADPDVGMITSVAPAHLSGLRSLAGIAREKGELFRRMRPDGVIVVNEDDPWVRRLADSFPGRKITYGKDGKVRGAHCRFLDGGGMEFTLCVGRQQRRIRLRLSGLHNVSNAVGAAAMAFGLGVDFEAIHRGLEAVRPFPMRMQLEKWKGIGIVNDAYNANPASMEAALTSLAAFKGSGKKVAVLGDMLELGRQSAMRHRHLGRQAARLDIDWLYLLGAAAGHVRDGALRGGMKRDRVIVGRNHRDLARHLSGRVKRGDWLLFKGSRGMRMENVLTALKEIGV
jgi:UDP-N-acetylmuramoyl-tripeptide--D-alanyl-D-alanine ligase